VCVNTTIWNKRPDEFHYCWLKPVVWIDVWAFNYETWRFSGRYRLTVYCRDVCWLSAQMVTLGSAFRLRVALSLRFRTGLYTGVSWWTGRPCRRLTLAVLLRLSYQVIFWIHDRLAAQNCWLVCACGARLIHVFIWNAISFLSNSNLKLCNAAGVLLLNSIQLRWLQRWSRMRFVTPLTASEEL